MLQGLYWSEALSTANIMTLISKCVLGYVSFYCYVSASVFFFFLISMNLLTRGPMTLVKTRVLIVLGQGSANWCLCAKFGIAHF